jgi:hypothetical protein
MTVWTWILVAVGGSFVVSLLVGLAIAAILNNSGRQLSEIIELEAWTSSPLMDVNDEPGEDAAHRDSGREYSGSRLA